VTALGRILVIPPKVVVASAETGYRAGRLVGRVPVRVASRTRRLLGLRGTLALLVGLALGLLFAPVPGRELRAKLKALRAKMGAVSDAELADRVAFELEHAPRTWHLPQPRVSVGGGRVVLTGEIDHDDARQELARVAGAVPGVAGVDNLVVVSPGAGESDHDPA
jgi:hypothetical protein